MASKITVRSGLITPLCSANDVAKGSSSTVDHNPWEMGIRGYLVQDTAGSVRLAWGEGEEIVPTADAVVILTDADSTFDDELKENFGPNSFFRNGAIYAAADGADVRLRRVHHRDGEVVRNDLLDVAFVIHSTNPVAYKAIRNGTSHHVEMEWEATDIRVLVLSGTSVTEHSIEGSSTIEIKSGGGAAAAEGGEEGGGMPWPPK